jgi:hypothetical protein
MRTHISEANEGLIPIVRCRGIAKRIIIYLLPILFLLNISAIPENAFWEKKDYRHWSEQECKKMLVDSPWAKGLLYNSTGYVVWLFSALPIRQAIVRQKQIAENYDKLSPEKRQEFDRRTEEYLSEQFPDTIVVRVVNGYHLGESAHYGKPVSFPCPYWQMQTTDMLKNTVSLIPSKGDRISLQRFIAPRPNVCEFQFIFPRKYKGRPALSPQDKSLSLEFTGPPPAPVKQNQDFERMLIEFNVSKMKFKGDVVY